MPTLHDRLATQVSDWRSTSYPAEGFPTISEILDWARDPESGQLRYLRAAQFRALETYWYLSLIEKTPHILSLYQKLFPARSELLDSLGVGGERMTKFVLDSKGGVKELWDRVRTDDDFVRDFKLESLRETLTLDYPSYILALAMGAGKTILIGAIIATEFAMAMEYPKGPFVQNSLVFAPVLT